MRTAPSARWQLLGAAALFSTGGAVIKACSLTGWQVGGLRSGIAVLAFLAIVPEARRVPRPKELFVALAYAACLVAFVLSNKLTTAADAIFLQSSAPLYVLLLGPLFLHEKIARRDLAVMGVVAIGIALFFVDQMTGGGASASATAPNPSLGRWVALASGVAWALTMVGLRWLGARGEGGGATAVVAGNALAALVCAPFALPISVMSTHDLGLVLFLGVFQIALAYKLVTRAMQVVPAFEATVILLVEPVFNPLWAWIVHSERPTAWALAGGAVILGATLYKTWSDARSPAVRVSSP